MIRLSDVQRVGPHFSRPRRRETIHDASTTKLLSLQFTYAQSTTKFLSVQFTYAQSTTKLLSQQFTYAQSTTKLLSLQFTYAQSTTKLLSLQLTSAQSTTKLLSRVILRPVDHEAHIQATDMSSIHMCKRFQCNTTQY